MKVGILTVSDGCWRGERADESGDAIAGWVAERGYDLEIRAVVPDETSRIAPLLQSWSDARGVDLIVSTGGTGMAPRDVTPEATRSVLEREAPGIAEEIRRRGLSATPFSLLSRGVVGVRGHTLIVNLPGSPGGVRDGLAVLDPLVEHAVRLARGEAPGHSVQDADGGPA